MAAASVMTAGFAATEAKGQTVALANFDFENAHFNANTTGQTPTPVSVAAEGASVFNQSMFTGFHANASSGFSNGSPLGGNGAYATTWTTGDYWQFNTSSAGYNVTSLAFAVNGSNTGPRDFELEYSLTNASNASYTNIAGYAVTLAAQNLSFNLSGIAAVANQASVYFRFVNYDTISVSGATVASGGTNRLDNVVLSGVVPGGASGVLTFDPAATAGGTASTMFTTAATVKNFIDSGTNVDVAYVDGNAVTFSNLGVGPVVVQAAGVNPSSVAVTNTTGTYTFSGGAINGSTGLTKSGAGTLVLGMTNTYTGGTSITGGIVQVSADADLGTGTLTLNGGELQVTAGFTSAKTLNLAGAGTIDTGANTLAFTTVPSGSGSLTKLGTGTLALNSSNGSIGPLIVNAGAITIDTTKTFSFENLGNTTTPSTINGTLNVGSTNADVVELEPVANSTVGGTGTINIAPGSAIVQFPTGTSTISANLAVTTDASGNTPVLGGTATGRILNITGNIVDGTAGAGGVNYGGTTVTGNLTGKVVLSGTNTYSGGTFIGAGTVVANGSSGSLGTGTVVVGTFNTSTGILAGNGTSKAPVVIASAGLITAGSGSTANDSIGTLTVGAATFNSGGGYVAKLNATTADRLVLSGLTVNSVSGASFAVTLQNVSGGATSLTPGTQYVLAVDTNLADVGLFNSSIASGALTLAVGNLTASDGSALTLVESDTSSGEGLDLDVGTVAAPEPTSLLLMAVAVGPLAIGRRRRNSATTV